MSDLSKLHPWWHVDIHLAGTKAPFDFYVQAPTSRGAIMIALGMASLEDGDLIHQIHVGRPVERPQYEHGVGWHKLETPK